jgi:hypothetical protein
VHSWAFFPLRHSPCGRPALGLAGGAGDGRRARCDNVGRGSGHIAVRSDEHVRRPCFERADCPWREPDRGRGVLAYFSALRVRRRDQLSKLAAWPGPDPSHMSSPSLATVLSHCARTLEVPRVLVVWEEVDEPFVNVAVWKDNVYEHTREIAGGLDDFLRSKHYSDSIFVTHQCEIRFCQHAKWCGSLKAADHGRGTH